MHTEDRVRFALCDGIVRSANSYCAEVKPPQWVSEVEAVSRGLLVR